MISHRLALIDGAEQSLTVEMAYLSDRRFTAALARAVQRGVEVNLVTADQADVLANINRATCDALMRLTGAPVNLTIVLLPRMVHSKVVVIDHRFSDIGSANFTPLSHGVYDEINLYVDDRGVRARGRGRDRGPLRATAASSSRGCRTAGCTPASSARSWRTSRGGADRGDVVSTLDTGERAKQERRRQILAAAKAVFAEAGYHGASIHAIIERAQIARGTFYLYFESKAAVFDSILDQAMADLRARLHRIEVDAPERAAAAGPAPRAGRRRRSSTSSSDRPLATLLLSAGHTPTSRPPSGSSSSSPRSATCCAARWRRAWRSAWSGAATSELVAAALLGMIRGVIELMVRQTDAARPTGVLGRSWTRWSTRC